MTDQSTSLAYAITAVMFRNHQADCVMNIPPAAAAAVLGGQQH